MLDAASSPGLAPRFPSDLPISPTLALHLGLVVAIVGLGVAFGRYIDLDSVRAGLPNRVRAAVELIAFGVFGALLFVDGLSIPVVDRTVAAFGVFLALWIGLPYLASRVIEPGTPPQGVSNRGCDR